MVCPFCWSKDWKFHCLLSYGKHCCLCRSEKFAQHWKKQRRRSVAVIDGGKLRERPVLQTSPAVYVWATSPLGHGTTGHSKVRIAFLAENSLFNAISSPSSPFQFFLPGGRSPQNGAAGWLFVIVVLRYSPCSQNEPFCGLHPPSSPIRNSHFKGLTVWVFCKKFNGPLCLLKWYIYIYMCVCIYIETTLDLAVYFLLIYPFPSTTHQS